jgi:hypothetical protein
VLDAVGPRFDGNGSALRLARPDVPNDPTEIAQRWRRRAPAKTENGRKSRRRLRAPLTQVVVLAPIVSLLRAVFLQIRKQGLEHIRKFQAALTAALKTSVGTVQIAAVVAAGTDPVKFDEVGGAEIDVLGSRTLSPASDPTKIAKIARWTMLALIAVDMALFLLRRCWALQCTPNWQGL